MNYLKLTLAIIMYLIFIPITVIQATLLIFGSCIEGKDLFLENYPSSYVIFKTIMEL